MRVFHIDGLQVREFDALPATAPMGGYVWIALSHAEFEAAQVQVHAALQVLCGTSLVDLHVSDLLNQQLPSHFDYTAQYDLLVFRRLAQGRADADLLPPVPEWPRQARRGGPPVLRRIDTSPVGFALFDQVLLTVHPVDCTVREAYAARLLSLSAHQGQLPPHGSAAVEPREARLNGARLMPIGPADLMLRLVNQMVDGYLDLRRELTRQLDHWQGELLDPRARFNNWSSLLDARLALHHLDEICEDQRAAVQDWIEALGDWTPEVHPGGQRELDLLKVRSRDVLEHIERVVHHVRRLEHSAEAAVQMHFSAQGHRTNEIMRTLTVLTAIFMPLNLIAGVFGMNFEFIPFLHTQAGFWMTMVSMTLIALLLSVYFWRKRYLERSR